MKIGKQILQFIVFFALATIGVGQYFQQSSGNAKLEVAIFGVVIVNVVGILMLIRYALTEGRNRWVVLPSYHLPTTEHLEIERLKLQSTLENVETPSALCSYYALHMVEILQLVEILDKSESRATLQAEPHEFDERAFEQSWQIVLAALVRGGHQLQIYGGRYIPRMTSTNHSKGVIVWSNEN